MLAGKHLVENAPKRKDITTLIGISASGLFRRHIGSGANDGSSAHAPLTRVGELESAVAVAVRAIAFANPKSNTFTLPSVVIFTFAAFRSRRMMAFSCAASNASEIITGADARFAPRRSCRYRRPAGRYRARSRRESPSTRATRRSARVAPTTARPR